MNLSGVYLIQNLVNNKVYVGASKNVRSRLWDHKWQLKAGVHHNAHLQCAFNECGEKNFSFEVLEYCEEEFIFSQENYWCNMLNSHNRKYGYNLDSTSPSGKSGVSDETRRKMSEGAGKRSIDCYTVYGDFYRSFSDLYKCAEHFNAVAPNVHRRMNIHFNKKNLIDSQITKYIMVDSGMSVDDVKSYWQAIFQKLKASKPGKYSVYDCFNNFITTADSRSLSETLEVSINTISTSVARKTYLRTLKIEK